MTVSIKMDESLQQRLEHLAHHHQRPTQSLLHDAIEQYVVREEARESFLEEAATAWAEYQQTGRHLTHAEVSAWLDTWGTDAEQPAPPCHT